MRNGVAVSKVEGTYLGSVNFDGKRYWDGRRIKPFRLQFAAQTNKAGCLPSDSTVRQDLRMLEQGHIQ
jgi:hypothetical protein